MTDLERARSEAIAHHKAGVKGSLLVEYRCRVRKCLLLRVWETPNGPEFFARDRQSDGIYSLLNSYDLIDDPGRRVPPGGVGPPARGVGPGQVFAGRLDDHPETKWVPLWCDHVRESALISAIRRDIKGRTPGRPKTVLVPIDTPN
jgi:hypothetical protein